MELQAQLMGGPQDGDYYGAQCETFDDMSCIESVDVLAEDGSGLYDRYELRGGITLHADEPYYQATMYYAGRHEKDNDNGEG